MQDDCIEYGRDIAEALEYLQENIAYDSDDTPAGFAIDAMDEDVEAYEEAIETLEEAFDYDSDEELHRTLIGIADELRDGQ